MRGLNLVAYVWIFKDLVSHILICLVGALYSQSGFTTALSSRKKISVGKTNSYYEFYSSNDKACMMCDFRLDFNNDDDERRRGEATLTKAQPKSSFHVCHSITMSGETRMLERRVSNNRADLNNDQQMNYFLSWFTSWSDLQKTDFIPVLASKLGKIWILKHCECEFLHWFCCYSWQCWGWGQRIMHQWQQKEAFNSVSMPTQTLQRLGTHLESAATGVPIAKTERFGRQFLHQIRGIFGTRWKQAQRFFWTRSASRVGQSLPQKFFHLQLTQRFFEWQGKWVRRKWDRTRKRFRGPSTIVNHSRRWITQHLIFFSKNSQKKYLWKK